MTHVLMPIELGRNIAAYLSRQPYGDVAQMIEALSKLQSVTVEPPPAPSAEPAEPEKAKK